MIRAVSDAALLHVLSGLPRGQTLLSLADRLWPGRQSADLLLQAVRFPGAPLPLSPVERLRRQVRALARCGLVVLRPCPAGLPCHGTQPFVFTALSTELLPEAPHAVA